MVGLITSVLDIFIVPVIKALGYRQGQLVHDILRLDSERGGLSRSGVSSLHQRWLERRKKELGSGVAECVNPYRDKLTERTLKMTGKSAEYQQEQRTPGCVGFRLNGLYSTGWSDGVLPANSQRGIVRKDK